jgi:hypothetical protein
MYRGMEPVIAGHAAARNAFFHPDHYDRFLHLTPGIGKANELALRYERVRTWNLSSEKRHAYL